MLSSFIDIKMYSFLKKKPWKNLAVELFRGRGEFNETSRHLTFISSRCMLSKSKYSFIIF